MAVRGGTRLDESHEERRDEDRDWILSLLFSNYRSSDGG